MFAAADDCRVAGDMDDGDDLPLPQAFISGPSRAELNTVEILETSACVRPSRTVVWESAFDLQRAWEPTSES